jgi:hypothetical protein
MTGSADTYIGWEISMKKYEFAVILQATEITDALEEALGEFGCLDGLLSACDGVISIIFNRESDSLENAIRSAIADVQRAGARVKSVSIERESEILADILVG